MDNLHRNFGLTIAFLIPGFVTLWGVSDFSPTLSGWLATSPGADPTIGSFLYLAIASLALGLIVSAIRWATIDQLHHRTGVNYPHFDFSKLPERLDAFVLSVEWYYRYYQFYANMLVAIAILSVCELAHGASLRFTSLAGVLALEGILFGASRDSLRRYYSRASDLLGTKKEAVPLVSRSPAPDEQGRDENILPS